MTQKIQTNLRLDEDVLIEAKEILKKLGMNFTEAVNIFTNMVVQEKGLPFNVKVPNQDTLKAIEELKNGETEKVTLQELEEEAKKCLV